MIHSHRRRIGLPPEHLFHFRIGYCRAERQHTRLMIHVATRGKIRCLPYFCVLYLKKA